ncbi:hypothetical protein HRbin36_01997 [bacterium HR36]|nr:hypothetical protein HRbin36_01997 [bacterium HR36]
MWHTLLARIGNEETSGLILSLNNGGEISVQQILALQESLLIVRGRWAGSSESGWTFFVPLERLVCLCFPRDVPAALGDLVRPKPSDSASGEAPLLVAQVPSVPTSGPTPTSSASAEAALSISQEPSPTPNPQTHTPCVTPVETVSATLPSDHESSEPSLAQRLQELRQRIRQRLGQNPPGS